MTEHPVLTAIRERRSIRRFTDEPVDTDALLAIAEAARWAPSGKNNQPCRLLIIRAGDPRQATLAGLTAYRSLLERAQALLCLFLERERCYDTTKDHQAAGAAIQNMLLASHALGLGAVWVGEIINRGADVTKALGLDPERFELQVVVALGHPAEQGSSRRRPLEEFLLEVL